MHTSGREKVFMSTREKIYNTMSSAGVISLVSGIIIIVSGLVVGIMMVVSGAMLISGKKKVLF